MTFCNRCDLPIHLVTLDNDTKVRTEPHPHPDGVIAARYIKGRRYGLHGTWYGHWITDCRLVEQDERRYRLHDTECARNRTLRRTVTP